MVLNVRAFHLTTIHSNIWYCSRDCQVANWKAVHAKSCAALKVKSTDRPTDGQTDGRSPTIYKPTTPGRPVSQVARVCRETEGQRAEVEPDFEVAYLKGLAGKSIMQWPPRAIPDTWPAFFQVWRGRRLMGGEAVGMDKANSASLIYPFHPHPVHPDST